MWLYTHAPCLLPHVSDQTVISTTHSGPLGRRSPTTSCTVAGKAQACAEACVACSAGGLDCRSGHDPGQMWPGSVGVCLWPLVPLGCVTCCAAMHGTPGGHLSQMHIPEISQKTWQHLCIGVCALPVSWLVTNPTRISGCLCSRGLARCMLLVPLRQSVHRGV